jgi:hypothetical protein
MEKEGLASNSLPELHVRDLFCFPAEMLVCCRFNYQGDYKNPIGLSRKMAGIIVSVANAALGAEEAGGLSMKRTTGEREGFFKANNQRFSIFPRLDERLFLCSQEIKRGSGRVLGPGSASTLCS